MQLILAFAILILSALVDSDKLPPGSPERYEDDGAKYIWGQRKPRDRDIHHETVYADKKLGRKVRHTLDMSRHLYRLSTVTCIEVEDLSKQKDRGTVTVTKGGVNYRYITINFESNRGKGLNFKVTLYSDEIKY